MHCLSKNLRLGHWLRPLSSWKWKHSFISFSSYLLGYSHKNSDNIFHMCRSILKTITLLSFIKEINNSESSVILTPKSYNRIPLFWPLNFLKYPNTKSFNFITQMILESDFMLFKRKW